MNEKLETHYKTVKSLLEEKWYNISEVKEINYWVQFSIKTHNSNWLIRIYINKKSEFTLDFSQIKNSELENSIKFILNYKTKKKDKEEITTEIDTIPIIWTDESWKGDYFWPLVIASVYINEKTLPILKSLWVKDSKKISDKKIMELAENIKEICKEQFSIIEITPKTYNRMYTDFKIEKQNLNYLLAWWHAKAIEETLWKVDCNIVLSDKFWDEKLIIDKLQKKWKLVTLKQQHKAESNIAVAAASILARARFLYRIEKLSKVYNIKLGKWASTNVINQAKIINKKYWLEELEKVAKLHFKTSNSVLDA